MLWGHAKAGRGIDWLGHPGRNLLHRIMTEGVAAATAKGTGGVNMPDGYDVPLDVAVAAEAIAVLPQGHVDVLRMRYVRQHSDRDGCAMLGISRTEYRRRMNEGTFYIAGALMQYGKGHLEKDAL